MHRLRSFVSLPALFVAAACSPYPTETAASPASTESPDAAADARGAASTDPPLLPCDAAAIAAKHAAFVGPAVTHPMTVHARLHRATGETEEHYSWDGARVVQRGDSAGLTMSSGTDDQGPWSVDETGVLVRLKPDEIRGRDAIFWIFQHAYVNAMRAGAATTRCTDSDRHETKEALVTFGDALPKLVFDRASARLLEMEVHDPSGRVSHVRFDDWSGRDASGSRYVSKWTTWPQGSEAVEIVEKVDATGPCALATDTTKGATCVAAPKSTFVLDLPPSDKPAFVPVHFSSHELLVRAQVGTDSTWGLVDTGAGISTLDTTTARGAAFVPSSNLDIQSPSETFVAGVGVLPRVSFGSVVAHSLPVAAIPVPVLAAFGSLRPEIVLGFSFFASGTLRVDYAKKRIALSKLGDAPHSADAIAIPFRILDGRFVASIEIEGRPLQVMLDTGNSGTLSLDAQWAVDSGVFAGHQDLGFFANESAGSHETGHTLVRARTLKIGSVTANGVLVDISRSPAVSDVVGLLGNGIFSLCQSAVFDTAGRTLWLEPPCATTTKRGHFAWEILPQEPAADADAKTKSRAASTWIVAKLVPTGSADRAGIHVGDEIVQVGAIRLGADPSVLDAIDLQPAGTHVKVVVRRDGKLLPIDMTFVELLPM